MAEAAGLALGGIALVSLFKSCVDLFEYFELGKSYHYDYHLASTKVRLLRARLNQWGDELQSQQTGEDDSLICSEKCTTITDSLLGIKEILGCTDKFGEKYGIDRRRVSILQQVVKLPLQLINDRETRVEEHYQKRSNSISLRRRTTWAIHDKRRFDLLIADLDFFITNLEKVGVLYNAQPSINQPRGMRFERLK